MTDIFRVEIIKNPGIHWYGGSHKGTQFIGAKFDVAILEPEHVHRLFIQNTAFNLKTFREVLTDGHEAKDYITSGFWIDEWDAKKVILNNKEASTFLRGAIRDE